MPNTQLKSNIKGVASELGIVNAQVSVLGALSDKVSQTVTKSEMRYAIATSSPGG